MKPLQLGSFFLLHPNTESLKNILENLTLDEIESKRDVFQAFTAEVLRVFEAEQGLKLFNACQVYKDSFIIYIN